MTMKVAVSLPDEILTGLDQLASRRGCSRSALVASAIQTLLDEDFVATLNEYVDAETSADRDESADWVELNRSLVARRSAARRAS